MTGSGHRGRPVGQRGAMATTRPCGMAYRGRAAGDDCNWLDPWYGTPRPTDIGGPRHPHPGLALGRGGIGVAPGGRVVRLRQPGAQSGQSGALPGVHAVHAGALSPRRRPLHRGGPSSAAHVVNNSWGCPPWRGATRTLWRRRCRPCGRRASSCVASAGNSGPRCGSVSDPLAIYLGPSAWGPRRRREDVWDSAAGGRGGGRQRPDQAGHPGAGGGRALGPARRGATAASRAPRMAGPHVAGVVALMWSAQPTLIGDVGAHGGDPAPHGPALPGAGGGLLPGRGAQRSLRLRLLDAYAAVKAAMEMK